MKKFVEPRPGTVYSQGNEVIIPSSGESAEDIARASVITKPDIIIGGDLNILRPFKFIDPIFLAIVVSSDKTKNELSKKAQGKSVVHIHNSDIQEVLIPYPSLKEQKLIGNFFQKLDSQITLHQRE